MVPEHLKRFICVENFESRVAIKRTGPREIGQEATDALLAPLCKLGALDANNSSINESGVEQKDQGILWPNPLLDGFRQMASSRKNARLQELWHSSTSHGISWDALDKLYMSFRDARDASIEEWNKNAPEIVDFASKVAKEKIMRWLDGCHTCPPRLLRKWTHLIYNRWMQRYLHIYSPRMLSRFLKGEVTDRVLMREFNECAGDEASISELPYASKPSEYNPHFVRRVVKGGDI